jgi:hypothetical protein
MEFRKRRYLRHEQHVIAHWKDYQHGVQYGRHVANCQRGIRVGGGHKQHGFRR